MSRFAQIRSAMGTHPWEWAGYFLSAALIIATYVLQFGMTGFWISLFGIGIAALCLVLYFRRHPRLNSTEVGEVQLEVAFCSPGQPSPKVLAGAVIGYAVLLAFLAGSMAIGVLRAYLEGSSNDAASLRSLAQAVATAALWAFIAFFSYRTLWPRLLVTNQGLFRIVDAVPAWRTRRDIHESGSPLRAMKVYGWEQIARFQWSRQQSKHVLHLNVRQTGIRVPQLASFTFPSLTDEDQQQFDALLHKYLLETTSLETGRSLTASAAP